MRTLEELLVVAREAEAAYKARVASAEQELQQETEAAHKAQEAAGVAIACGDKAAYDRALRDDEYHRGRAAMLKKQHLKSEFTPEEHAALFDEACKAYFAEVKPLKKRLCELAEEWKSITKEMSRKSNFVDSIRRSLDNAHIPDYVILRMPLSERPHSPHEYRSHGWAANVEKSYSVPGDVLEAIGYYKYKKEKEAHE